MQLIWKKNLPSAVRIFHTILWLVFNIPMPRRCPSYTHEKCPRAKYRIDSRFEYETKPIYTEENIKSTCLRSWCWQWRWTITQEWRWTMTLKNDVRMLWKMYWECSEKCIKNVVTNVLRCCENWSEKKKFVPTYLKAIIDCAIHVGMVQKKVCNVLMSKWWCHEKCRPTTLKWQMQEK